MEQTVFSVSELNLRIKGLVESDPMLGNVCVRGELSNYKIYPSGHHYFTLKDAESSLKCVMFRTSASKLRFKPENGMGVTAFGRVSVYPRDGAYQLYCTGLSPEGMGDLYVAYEQLKAKLQREGLFDQAHKKPLPEFPGRIVVITSGAGAAVRDIIRILGKRWPLSKVYVMPVRVQGVEAPAEIVGALRYANVHKLGDVIITGRGGGSIEDLWAFNDERVARAIYASDIPVISAVGHEPDVTISDYVADMRASTPSNAAEIAVPDMREIMDALSVSEARQYKAIERKMTALSTALNDLASRRVMQSQSAYIDIKRMELDRAQARMETCFSEIFNSRKSQFAAMCAKLDAMSPLKVLGRGYAIARDAEGCALRSASQVEKGDRISIRLERGALDCLVEEKTEVQ